ncbi:MAG TPA: 5-(carboxyamino)imidazole ribonucleotide synthase [Chryseolinea sp.]|nr:5-(carboxyamino)imidazole ribonucleotide synthase [Chryseolinea sp.]
MNILYQSTSKVGVLGGGQLGRMLIQSGIDFNVPFKVLDPDAHAPCASLAEFVHGKLKDFDTVLAFGEDCDVITIEIEHVNTDALKVLEAKGKRVYPQPSVIELIQDKRKQKQFYAESGIPTAPFVLVENSGDVKDKATQFPVVNKLGREGYDGRGVQILRSAADLGKAFDAPGLLESLIDFDKEIAVIVARSSTGEIKTFPAVEMVFHPEQNLVEYLYSPAELSEQVLQQAERVARTVIQKLSMVGVLAVEMFVTKSGEVLVNEVAPRPHNSGHQTIEANVTSQYEQHLRAILGLPLGDTSITRPSAMVNLLGESGHEGIAKYQGFTDVLALPGVHVHLYGKQLTKPFRKMGHVTIADADPAELKRKVQLVKNTLKVIS